MMNACVVVEDGRFPGAIVLAKAGESSSLVGRFEDGLLVVP